MATSAVSISVTRGKTGGKTGPKPKPLGDRFWPKVDASGGAKACWPWTGTKLPRGYGTVGLGGRAAGKGYSHRVAWELANGEIPEGLFVLHKCDNPPCCNPSHLFLGTNADNTHDCIGKKRHAHGERSTSAKLNERQVEEIVSRRRQGERLRAIAARFGVSEGQICNIAKGNAWKHVARR